MIFDNNYLWLISLCMGIAYYKRKKIPYLLNDAYISIKNAKNNILQKKAFSKNPNYNFNNGIIILEYKYFTDTYVLLAKDTDTILYPPYMNEEVEEFKNRNSLVSMIKSKNDIIFSELHYEIGENSFQTDVIDIVQKLCGPMVDFYKNTQNSISPDILKRFFELFIIDKHGINDTENNAKDNISVKSLNVMFCDGITTDLLL